MKTDEIKKVLGRIPAVKLGYLFGSQAQDAAGPLSDTDIAVYLDEPDQKRRFEIRLELMHAISKAIQDDALDVVVLNDAAAPLLKYEIINEGTLFYEQEPFKVLVEPRILNEYFDFRDSLAHFYDEPRVLEQKISAIKKYLGILKGYERYTLAEMSGDLTVRGAVERYLYLLVQATIDLAEAIIALKEFRKPAVYSEAFEILHEEGVLDEGLTEQLVRMAGFRNIIAHDYEKLDFSVVYDVLHQRMGDIGKFLTVIEKQI